VTPSLCDFSQHTGQEDTNFKNSDQKAIDRGGISCPALQQHSGDKVPKVLT
jgi:hypothetical protein